MARLNLFLLFSLVFAAFVKAEESDGETQGEYAGCFDDDEDNVHCENDGVCYTIGSIITADLDNIQASQDLRVKSVPMIFATASNIKPVGKSLIKRVAKGCVVLYSEGADNVGYVHKIFMLKSAMVSWVMIVADESFYYKITDEIERITEEDYHKDITQFNDLLNEELIKRGYTVAFNITGMAKTGYISPEATHVFMPVTA